MRRSSLRHALSCPLLSGVAALALAGCTNSTPTQSNSKSTTSTSSSPVLTSSDDADVFNVLTQAGAELKQDTQGRVVEIKLSPESATPSTIEAMTRLPKLRAIVAGNCGLTDEQILPLAKMNSIQVLDLRENKLTNASLEAFTALRELRVLRLSGLTTMADIDDIGIAALAKLPALRVLALDGLFVGSSGLQAIQHLPIEELYVSKTLVDDSSMEIIAQFPNLKKLRLAKAVVSDDGLMQLRKLPKLEMLDLTEMGKLTDAGMSHVGQIKSLKHLNLWRVGVTDEGVQALSGLENLTWLNLDNTQMTDVSLPALSGMKQLEFLHLGSTAISDAGLPALEGLTQLKELIVTRTAVTEEGVAKLQKSLPTTKIQLVFKEKN